MTQVRDGAGCFGVCLVLLCPLVVMFALPIAVGVGLDVFGLAGERAVALALGTPVLAGLLGAVLTQRAPHLRSAVISRRPAVRRSSKRD